MSWKPLLRLSQTLRRGFYTSSKWKSEWYQKPPERDDQDGTKNEVVLPEEPTYCCMSGCANCVWIKYAQELAQCLGNGDEIARKKILEKVRDPNHRAFLFTQLGLKETESGN